MLAFRRFACWCLLFACVAAAPLWPHLTAQAAAPEPPVGNASAPAAEKKLTEQEALAVAQALAQQGRREEAANLYRALIMHGHNEDYRAEAAFQLAGLFMGEGHFRPAIVLYLRLLNHNPNLARVRLELARAYYLNGDYDDAQLQFELLKGSDLPEPVQERVDAFLTHIRRKKDWTFDVGLTLVPDSNINQVSGGEEECISFGGYLLCRPLEEKRNGIGLNASGTFNHYLHFTRDVGIHTTVGLDALEYERNDFDDYQISFASGPRVTFESGEISARPTFHKRWYASRQYSEEWGLRLDGQKSINRFILYTGASWAKTRYNDPWLNQFLRGELWATNGMLRYILNDRTFLQGRLAFQRENTAVKTYSSDNWRYGLGAYRLFPWGFALFTEVSLTTTRYRDQQWYVTEDYRIDETRRADKTWQVFTSLSSDFFEAWDITPMLQYVYAKRDSNIWSHDYERHRVNLSFNYRF